MTPPPDDAPAAPAPAPPIRVPYFLARPTVPPPWPGVLVVHEGNGMSPQLLRVCQRLAAEGFVALAPDLFWRFGGSDPNEFAEHLRSIRHADVVADLGFAVDELRSLGAMTVGVTGFCMGGRFTYLAALSGLDIQCAAPFYGTGIDTEPGEAHCPLLIFFGGVDEYIPPEAIEAARARHPDDTVVYPEAGHGFMRDGSESYDDAAATDAWSRLLAFFGRYLSA